MRLSRRRDLLIKLFECINSDYDTYICDFMETNPDYIKIADKYRPDIIDKLNDNFPDASQGTLRNLIYLIFALISIHPVNPLSFHFSSLIENLKLIYVGDVSNFPNNLNLVNKSLLKCACGHSTHKEFNVFVNKNTNKHIHIGSDCIDVIHSDFGSLCKFIHKVLEHYRETKHNKLCIRCKNYENKNKYLGSYYYQTYFNNNPITPYSINKAKKSYNKSVCIRHYRVS